MNAETPLDRLAKAYGIQPGYEDIWQRHHEISAETKRKLLGAMGVHADSDKAIAGSLEAIVEKRAKSLIQEVLVQREDERITLPVIAKKHCKGRFAWSFQSEEGAEKAGEGSLEDLEVVERIDAGGAVSLGYALALPIQPAPGYHRCTLVLDEMESAEVEIIVSPKTAFLPDELKGPGSLTGLMAPLYGLCSKRNAGIGDFADLAALATATAPLGAGFVGINPTHALFPTMPGRISPYAPSNRHRLNVLMIALDDVPELEQSGVARDLMESPEGAAALGHLRAADLVDYPAVTAFKLKVLEALFESFVRLPEDTLRKAAFRDFREAAGTSLVNHTRFDTLTERILLDDPVAANWRRWPDGYRTPKGPLIEAFAEQQAERITFYAYLQWLADEQLANAQRHAIDAGMTLGLYRDLAVGVAPDGAEAWADQDALVDGVRIGAPPDDFNPDGQNWGLLPLSPSALRAKRYRPFIDLIRNNMRHAGMLRIDHVIGLAKSFWQPLEEDVPGAYVSYPLDDLLGLVALESVRNRCVVVGEDLGTVPDTLRTALDDRDLLGCRLVYFERDGNDACRPAVAYPRNSIASIGTHDLPTLRGFWEGNDIAWREKLGQYSDTSAYLADRKERESWKIKLLQVLRAERLLPDGIDPGRPPATLQPPLALAFHRFLGKTTARMKAVQLEDIVGASEQANLPGTVDEYPNWRRKIVVTLDDLAADEHLKLFLEAATT